MRLSKGICAAICVAALAGAAPAQADLYADDDADPANSTCTQAAPCSTIGKATAVAAPGDRVRVGPGTYPERVGFHGLTLIGAGPGDPGRPPDPARDTSVTGEPFSPSRVPATLVSWGGGSIEGMRVSASPDQDAVRVWSVESGHRVYGLRDVVLVGGGGDSVRSGAAVNAEAFQPSGQLTLDIAEAHLSQASPATGMSTVSMVRSYTSIRDSTVVPPGGGTGIDMPDSGRLDVDRVHVSAAAGGATAMHVSAIRPVQTIVNIRRSRLTGERFGLDVVGRTGRLEVRDSLIESLPPPSMYSSTSAASLDATAPFALTATGTTLVSRGPSASGALRVHSSETGSEPLTATLTNSIVRASDPGVPDIETSANTIVTANHSSFTDVSTQTFSQVAQPGSGTNVAGDPGFANEGGGDYSLSPGSPLIDRGDKAVVQPGELDLAGANRALDANGDCAAEPDIGAFERPAAPTCTPPQPPPRGDANAPRFTRGVKPTNRRFRVGPLATARTAAAKQGTRFRYALSEAATMTFKVERRAAGRRLGPVCVRPTKSNRRRKRCTRWTAAGTFTAAGIAGSNSTPWNGRLARKALKPAVYRVRVVATDAAGNPSTERRATFRIVRR